MTKFTATFSNGETVNRNSQHNYAFSWAVIRLSDGKIECFGFSADKANASKSAQSKMWSPISKKDKKNPALGKYHAFLAKDRGFASVSDMHAKWDADAAAHNAARKIEIVAIT